MVLTNGGGRLYDLPSGVSEIVSDECSYPVQGAERSELYKKKRWDGRKRMYDKQHGKFPVGLRGRIVDILGANGVEFTLEDKRTVPERSLDISGPDDSIRTREYQRDAVIAAITEGQSVVRVATGGGKTYIAAQLIYQTKTPTLFMVHTKDLLYQAKRELTQFLGIDIGQIGDGVVDVHPVTVATMQTVAKYLGVKMTKNEFDDTPEYKDTTSIPDWAANDIGGIIKEAGMIIWDEVHRIACDTAYGIMEKIGNAYYRVGLSASPWRDDGSDMMIEACMGRVCYSVNASELIKQEYLVRPIIKMVKVPASIPWFEDDRAFDTIYKEEVVENEIRNHLIVSYARDFMEMGIPFLILIQQIKHGEKLRKLITDSYHPIDFISGRDFTDKRLGAIQGMKDGDIPALIASTIADEGLDIKRLTGLILAGGGKSSTRALQRIGRVLRPYEGKTHALVVDLVDDAKYLRGHAMKRREIYATEPEFTILEI